METQKLHYALPSVNHLVKNFFFPTPPIKKLRPTYMLLQEEYYYKEENSCRICFGIKLCLLVKWAGANDLLMKRCWGFNFSLSAHIVEAHQVYRANPSSSKMLAQDINRKYHNTSANKAHQKLTCYAGES